MVKIRTNNGKNDLDSMLHPIEVRYPSLDQNKGVNNALGKETCIKSIAESYSAIVNQIAVPRLRLVLRRLRFCARFYIRVIGNSATNSITSLKTHFHGNFKDNLNEK